MNFDELAQPTMPGQKPQTLKIQNVTKVTVTNTGNGAEVQLHAPRAQTHVVKLPPGGMVQLDLIEPKVVHSTEK